MFILTKFQDILQIAPHEFYVKSRDIIEDKINEKYANKVVQRIGLCICMWDLTKCSEGLIGFGTGNVNVDVEFRMIVFRPFKGEIIAARIKQNTPSGIVLSTEFFDDIFVPETMLFENCRFDDQEKIWVWQTEGQDVYFDNGTIVHARIEKEKWEDAAKQAPAKAAKDGREPRRIPYSIEASMSEPGLGGSDWW